MWINRKHILKYGMGLVVWRQWHSDWSIKMEPIKVGIVGFMVDGLHAVFSCAWLLEEKFAVEIFDRKSSKLYELLRHSPLLVFFRRHFN